MRSILHALTRYWGRSLLAVLQTALAVGTVVAIVATGLPVLFGSRPGASPVFEARYGVEGESGQAPQMAAPAFTLSDVPYLTGQSDAIESAAIYQAEFVTLIHHEGQPYAIRRSARVSPEFAALAGVEVVEGSFFGPLDAEEGSPKVALVSEPLARYLFGSERASGKAISLRPREEAMALLGFAGDAPAGKSADAGIPLQIIGVFRPLTGDFASQGVQLLLPVQRTMQLPVALASSRGSAAAPPMEARFMSLFIKARPGQEQAAMEAVRLLLEPRLEERLAGRGGLPDFPFEGEPHVITGPAFETMQARDMLGAQVTILAAVGLLAAVVSGIAILTVSLVTMAEQVRAIALRRALGAGRGRIMGEMLLQSIVLATAGGLCGVAAAWPLGRLLGPLLPTASNTQMIGTAQGMGGGLSSSPWLVASLAGLLLAVAMGTVAGLYPAWDASRISAMEAWRESA